MADDDSFVFNLSSENKAQTLKIGLLDDRISLILENKSPNDEIYFSQINLSQLKQVCKAFQKINSLKDALLLLANTIEAGNIFLIEQKDAINLKLTIKTEDGEFPPFNIELILDEGQNNENEENPQEQEQEQEKEQEQQPVLKNNFEVLPLKFDYQGNREAEEKYGKTTKNTTEYNKPIIKSDYKQPIVQLEYIEPILQVHYPDGTTKSKALPPRIKRIDGITPNINEEQFRYIREQMNKSTEGGKNSSHYSTSSVPVSSFNNILSDLTEAKNAQNSANKEAEDIQEVPQTQYQSQIPIQYVQNSSQYSTRSVNPKPTYSSMQQQEFYNKTNVRNRSPPRNKTIEVAPRMINQSQNVYTNSNITYQNNFNSSYNQYQNYQNAISQSQIPTSQTKSQNPKLKGFATVVPLKQIKRPPNMARSQILIQKQQRAVNQYQPKPQMSQMTQMIPSLDEKPYEYDPQIFQQQLEIPYVYKAPYVPQQEDPNTPYEYNMEQQKERFQSQLKLQQEIVNAKTPIFPKILPTKIMDTKFEFPQGRDYEEKLLSEIKAQDHELQPFFNNDTIYNNGQYDDQYYQNNQSQSIQSQVLPIIYQQNNIQGAEDINQQIRQQIQSYNEQNIDKMNDMKVTTNNNNNEEYLGNNEVIEDNENENNEEEKQEKEGQEENQEENPDDDIEALFKNEEGYIIFRNGILRGIIHKYSEIDEVISKIQDKLMKGAKFNLLYKAFTDGDKASIFHQKCDNHPITLVLVETTEGVRFGGFTKKSWEGKHLKKTDNDAFVFSIDTGKCYDVKKNEPAIGCYPKFGPVFFGCQIRIYDDFFTKGGTTCLRGLNYNTDKDYELNNGEKTYIVKDIEVYEIETIDI